MRYDASMIQLTNTLHLADDMYSLICLSAAGLTINLSGTRCFLDGKYLLCLSADDTLKVKGGYYEALHLRFTPYFYNINLNHHVIGLPMYEEMRAVHGYPDFHLFRHRDDSYLGILPLDENGFRLVTEHLRRAGTFIAGHETDNMWSCRTRSEMIAVLRIAEGAGLPEKEGTDVIRYIQENIASELSLPILCQHLHTNRTTLTRQIRERTGMTPMQYVREERLRQSLPDLLFTFLPIGEVAEKYGFSDPNYYIRLFRQRYGKTPQQYRTEGFDSRIRGEEFFHRREQDVIRRTAFDRYLRHGMGRAILMLRETTDKTALREVFLQFLASPSHICGQYEMDLIDCFDDRDALAKEISQMFLDRLEQKEDPTAIRLLILLGEGDRVTEITERLYREAHEAMLAFLTSAEGRNSREKYPACAGRYMQITSYIGHYRNPEPTRVKQILTDIADFFRYTDDPPVPRYQNPLYHIMDGIGKKTLYTLLDEVAAEHPHGDKIHLKHEIRTSAAPDPSAAVTAEEILAADAWGDDFENKRLAFCSASPEVVRNVAEGVLAETDPERRRYLLSYFMPGPTDCKPPMFPLDPALLIRMAEEAELTGVKYDSYEDYRSPAAGEWIYWLLCRIRHPSVRAFGEKLMEENDEDTVLFRYGMMMVWGACYRSSDKEPFAAFLYRKDSLIRDTAFGIFTELLQKSTPDLPMNLLPYIWEESIHLSRRENLAKAMLASGTMTEKFREECRLDYFPQIRRLTETES